MSVCDPVFWKTVLTSGGGPVTLGSNVSGGYLLRIGFRFHCLALWIWNGDHNYSLGG